MREKIKKTMALLLIFCTMCAVLPVKAYAAPTLQVTWISKQYDEIFEFNGRVAVVKLSGKAGLIDKTGKEIAAPIYDAIYEFKDGLALVSNGLKFGLINNKGKLILPIAYDGIGDFVDGLSAVIQGDKAGYIDKTGKFVIPMKYSRAHTFNEGLAAVGIKVKDGYAGDKMGFIDKTGKVIIPLNYTFARDFSEGLAWVAKQDGFDINYGAIDKTGKVIIPFVYDQVNDFKNGAAYVLQYGNYFYIDKKGKKLTSEQEHLVSHDFNEDGITTVLSGGEYIYLDKTGKAIYPPTPEAYGFSEGLAAVRQVYKYGFIDKTGKLVIPFIYDNVGSFHEGLARVVVDRNIGFIDKSGNTVVTPKYYSATDFKDGFAIVQSGTNYGVIDKTGKEITPIIYRSINPYKEGYAVAVDDDFRKGIIDSKGEIVLPLIYNEVSDFSEGLARVKLNGKWGIVESPNSYIYDLQKQAAAVPTSSKVLVNGKEVPFDAYTIDGSNYFKLRDLAYVLNGTGKQFEVLWDNSKGAINLISSMSYTPAGGEMAKGSGAAQTAALNTSKIYKDGQLINLVAYTIKGNNYFKLRDIGQAFDFAVTWDGNTNTISIDTTKSYQ